MRTCAEIVIDYADTFLVLLRGHGVSVVNDYAGGHGDGIVNDYICTQTRQWLCGHFWKTLTASHRLKNKQSGQKKNFKNKKMGVHLRLKCRVRVVYGIYDMRQHDKEARVAQSVGR